MMGSPLTDCVRIILRKSHVGHTVLLIEICLKGYKAYGDACEASKPCQQWVQYDTHGCGDVSDGKSPLSGLNGLCPIRSYEFCNVLGTPSTLNRCTVHLDCREALHLEEREHLAGNHRVPTSFEWTMQGLMKPTPCIKRFTQGFSSPIKSVCSGSNFLNPLC